MHQSENLGNYQPTPQERESFDKMFRPANVLKVQTLSSGIIKIESSKSGYIEIYSTLDLKTLIKKELISSNDSVEIPIKAFQSGEYLLYLKTFSDNAVEEIATFKIK